MHRVIFLRIGGQKFHLLKLAGALLLLGSAFGVLGTIATVFRTVKQLALAQTNTQLALQVFGLLPESLSSDMVVGFLLTPSAWLMIWLALFVFGALLYRSGRLVLPIEEDSGV